MDSELGTEIMRDEVRLVHVFVKLKKGEYEIQEIALQEDRQKLVKFIRKKQKEITDRKAKIVFFNDFGGDNIYIELNLEESKNNSHYLFSDGGDKQINLDQKILNILCPFKVLYEYKKLRLEPPLYWCYRFKKVLDSKTNKHGMFQLALSRLQNKWCRGTSIFNTILLMRYFMLSFYILGDDKPVLFDKNTENAEYFFENDTFLEASAKISQGVKEKEYNEVKNGMQKYKDIENESFFAKYNKSKTWKDKTLNLYDDLTKAIQKVTFNYEESKDNDSEEDETKDDDVDSEQFKQFIKETFDAYLTSQYLDIQFTLEEWKSFLEKAVDEEQVEKLWDAIPKDLPENEKKKVKATFDLREGTFKENLKNKVKNKKKKLQEKINEVLQSELELIVEKYEDNNEVANKIIDKYEDGIISSLREEVFGENKNKLDFIIDTLKVPKDSLLRSVIEFVQNLIKTDDKKKDEIISNQNLLNLYRSYLVYKITGETVFFTNATYYEKLKLFLDKSDKDISFLLLYAKSKLKLNNEQTDDIRNEFDKITVKVKQDDLYYISKIEDLSPNEINELTEKNIPVSNLVSNRIKTTTQESDIYKYVCDAFLVPAYNDFIYEEKDMLVCLKVIRDSLVYLIENYERIPNDQKIKILNDNVEITTLDYVFSKVFECYFMMFAKEISTFEEKEIKVLCHVFLCLYYKRNDKGKKYHTFTSRIKKEFEIDEKKKKYIYLSHVCRYPFIICFK